MTDPLDNLFAQWTRLGSAFGSPPSPESPDPERLLLDTARHAHRAPRLFIMAATWLHRYGDLIARNRLRRLIREDLATEHRPALGLLLDIAHQGTHPPRFQAVTKDIPPAAPPRPLFDVESASPQLAGRAERRASDVSRRWGLWCAPIEFKNDALRPPRWVMAQNPGFTTRADLRGDLRSSILAALRHDPGAGESEFKLARLSGGSRAQVRNSLDNLELSGRVARTPAPGKPRIRIALMQPS